MSPTQIRSIFKKESTTKAFLSAQCTGCWYLIQYYSRPSAARISIS